MKSTAILNVLPMMSSRFLRLAYYPLSAVPVCIRDSVYKLVSKYRHQISKYLNLLKDDDQIAEENKINQK